MCEHFKKEPDNVKDLRYWITYINKETLIEDNKCDVCQSVCDILEHFEVIDRKKELERNLDNINKSRILLSNKVKNEMPNNQRWITQWSRNNKLSSKK